MEKRIVIGTAELKIMKVLWKEAEPVTSNYIKDKLEGQLDQSLSTLMSTLARLEKKGYVICDRSTRTNYYRSVITLEHYRAQEINQILKNLYDDNLTELVLDCLKERNGTADELKSLLINE